MFSLSALLYYSVVSFPWRKLINSWTTAKLSNQNANLEWTLHWKDELLLLNINVHANLTFPVQNQFGHQNLVQEDTPLGQMFPGVLCIGKSASGGDV